MKVGICATTDELKINRVKIICLPRTIGSTTGGMILQCAAEVGISPAAMLYADHIDSISSTGIILAEVWNNKK